MVYIYCGGRGILKSTSPVGNYFSSPHFSNTRNFLVADGKVHLYRANKIVLSSLGMCLERRYTKRFYWLLFLSIFRPTLKDIF